MDRVILNYQDSIVRVSDLELLRGPFWLNDTIVGFYLEYLEVEKYNNSNVCFVRPEVVQCLKFAEISEYDIFLTPLGFKEKHFAVMPLNNCQDPNKTGGSHWSLLVYSRMEGCFYHVDSLSGSNKSTARLLAECLASYLGIEFRLESLSSAQQNNTYDCGVYVLKYLELILEHISKKNSVSNVDLTRSFDVSQKRSQVKQLIKNLAS